MTEGPIYLQPRQCRHLPLAPEGIKQHSLTRGGGGGGLSHFSYKGGRGGRNFQRQKPWAQVSLYDTAPATPASHTASHGGPEPCIQ